MNQTQKELNLPISSIEYYLNPSFLLLFLALEYDKLIVAVPLKGWLNHENQQSKGNICAGFLAS